MKDETLEDVGVEEMAFDDWIKEFCSTMHLMPLGDAYGWFIHSP